jgi:hypothetical protein
VNSRVRESFTVLAEAPSVVTRIDWFAVKVLLEVGVKVSISPAALPLKATVIPVPMEEPALLWKVTMESAVARAPCRTAVPLTKVQLTGMAMYTEDAVETSSRVQVRKKLFTEKTEAVSILLVVTFCQLPLPPPSAA